MDPNPATSVQSLLTQFMPNLNKNMPVIMVEAGLDPLKHVVSGTDDLGSVNLGLCTANAKAIYAVENMTGLQTLLITAMTLGKIDASNPDHVVGTVSMQAQLLGLRADVSGGIEAGCGVLHEKVNIKGTATVEGATGGGEIDLVARLELRKNCLTQLLLHDFHLNYKSLRVDIQDLGVVFNQVLQPLEQFVLNALKGVISGGISSAVQNALNNLMNRGLPFCQNSVELALNTTEENRVAGLSRARD